MFTEGPHTLGLANDAGGEHVDPSATETLATTNSQPTGRYLCKITIVAHSLDDSKALFAVQHRDNADSEDPLESVVVAVPADDCKQLEVVFSLDDSERITVVPYVDFIGTAIVAINWQRL
jgi:hypothetical protein